MSDVKHMVRVNLVGKLSSDAKLERVSTAKGERPLVKFSMWCSSGKNRKTGEWNEPFYFACKVWGNHYAQMKKGDEVNVVGLMTRYQFAKDGKAVTKDTVEVVTDEHGEPSLSWHGDSQSQAGTHLSDEELAKGRGAVIQRNAKPDDDLRITDEDIPF